MGAEGSGRTRGMLLRVDCGSHDPRPGVPFPHPPPPVTPTPALACLVPATWLARSPQVYMVTSSFSIFAYFWLLVILVMWTPDVVTVTEGVLTFMFFWLVLGLAYAADRDFWGMFDKNKVAPEPTKHGVPMPAGAMDEAMLRELMKKGGLPGGTCPTCPRKRWRNTSST